MKNKWQLISSLIQIIIGIAIIIISFFIILITLLYNKKMYQNTKNTKKLISEMKTMLNNKPSKKGLLEGLVYGEDEENMMGPEMEQPSELGNEKQEVPTTETNPLDEDPEIAKLIIKYIV